jgi:hypothetical protein
MLVRYEAERYIGKRLVGCVGKLLVEVRERGWWDVWKRCWWDVWEKVGGMCGKRLVICVGMTLMGCGRKMLQGMPIYSTECSLL